MLLMAANKKQHKIISSLRLRHSRKAHIFAYPKIVCGTNTADIFGVFCAHILNLFALVVFGSSNARAVAYKP